MVDVSGYATGNFLRPEDIKALKDKTAIIMQEGILNEDTPFGKEQLEIPIKLSNGEEKIYGVNKTSAKNIAETYGDNTKDWINKKIRFEVLRQNVRGQMKDVVYAYAFEGSDQPKVVEEKQF